jgi:hypothetical protein
MWLDSYVNCYRGQYGIVAKRDYREFLWGRCWISDLIADASAIGREIRYFVYVDVLLIGV